MTSTMVQKLATTPIPVQLSATEFPALLFPPLSMPKRGPQCQRGSPRVFHLSMWGFDPRMPWTCVPMPQDTQGKPPIHYLSNEEVSALPKTRNQFFGQIQRSLYYRGYVQMPKSESRQRKDDVALSH